MADNEESGGLRQAAAAAPFVAGMGISLRNIINEGNINITTPSSPTAETMRAIYGAKQVPNVARDSNLFFEQFLERQGNKKLAQTAWLQAMRSVDPLTKQNIAKYTQGIEGMSDNDAFNSIRHLFKTSKSDFVQRQLFGRFSRNLLALEQQGGTFAYQSLERQFASPVKPPPPDMLKGSLSRIRETLGDYSTRYFAGEGGYGMYRFDFASKFGNIEVNVPVSQGGILVEGATQTTRRIAPDVMIFDPETRRATERLTREQYLLRQIEESIIPDIQTGRLSSHRDISRAIKELYAETVQNLESVPNVPEAHMTQAQRRYQAIRGQQVDVRVQQQRILREGGDKFIGAFRRPTTSEFGAAVEAEGLFGSTGPGALAQGRASYINLAEQSLTPNLVDTSRRPDQAVREYQLTQKSIEQLEDIKNQRYARYRNYQASANRAFQERMVNPSLKIMYVDPQDPRFASRFAMGEGEAVGRVGLRDIIEFETGKSAHLTHLQEGIEARITAGERLAPGTVLGFDEAGAPFQVTDDMEITTTTAHKNKGRGDYTTVHYKQRASFRHADKIFGDVKALVLMRENAELRNFARSVNADRHMQQLDLLVDINTLKKDPAKHAKQILTGMAENIHSRALQTENMKGFLENFEEYGKQWSQKGHRKFVEHAMDFALYEARMNPKEFGTVFGATPYALGKEEALGALASIGPDMTPERLAQYRTAMLGGIAGGVGEITYDSPAAFKGAGNMASIEPRANEILRRGPMGQLGVDISDELNRRLALSNPEKMQVHQELGKTLGTMTGEIKPGAGKVFNIGEDFNPARFQAFVEQGGGYIDPGKGMRQIYVPGANIVDKMRPFETAAGEKVTGNLSDIYRDIAESGARMYDPVSPISPGQYEKELQGHMQKVFRHYAPGGKGMGAVQRGKIAGTKFLRGVSEAGGRTISDVNVAGISDEMFISMMDEMEDQRIYSKAQREAIQESFMQGKRVGGVIARHPFIGDYSVQPIQYERVAGAGTNIVLPEPTVNITAAAGGEYKAATLRLGPLLGMAGDKDADNFAAMLVSPDNEKKIRRMLEQTDNEYSRRYTEHQVRMQLFEAGKPASSNLPTIKRMIADMEKTAAPKRYVAPLSVQMSEAKRALGAFGRGGAAADASALLEWLEQTPISAKHMSAEQVSRGGLEAMITDIGDAVRTRDAGRLGSIVENIVAGDEVARNMLTGSVRISQRAADDIGRATGIKIARSISGTNVQAGIQEMMRSLGEYETSGLSRMDQISTSRGPRIKMQEAAEFLSRMGDTMQAPKAGLMASVSRATQGAQNMLGAAGRGIIKHHKTIGFGFAGSLALSAILSNPKDSIGPMAPGPDPRGIMNKGKASSNMNKEKLHPTPPTLGQPSAPAVPWPERALLNFGASQQVNVKARTKHFIKSVDVAASLSNAHKGPLSVDIHDHRQTLNENVIANKMMQ